MKGLVIMALLSVGVLEANCALTYSVRLEPKANFAQSLTALRHLSTEEPVESSCIRQKSLLLRQARTKSLSLDISVIGEIAQNNLATLSEMLTRVKKDVLRKLLFAALDTYVDQEPLDKAFLDLMKCVEITYGPRSGENLLLQMENYQKPAKQLESILNQPAIFLLEPSSQHPTLKLEDLDEAVKRTLLHWFNGNEQLMRAHFVTKEQHELSEIARNAQKIYETLKRIHNNHIDHLWRLDHICQVDVQIAKVASGAISLDEAERFASNMQANVENGRKIKPSSTPEDDAKLLIELIQATDHDKVDIEPLVNLIDCALTDFKETEASKQFEKSPKLAKMLDELSSAMKEVQVEPLDDSVASEAEPDLEPNAEQSPEEPDYEDESDSDDDDDSDEEDSDEEDSDEEDDEEEDEEEEDDSEDEEEKEKDDSEDEDDAQEDDQDEEEEGDEEEEEPEQEAASAKKE